MKTEAPVTTLAGMMSLHHRPSPKPTTRFSLPADPPQQQRAEPPPQEGDAALANLIRLL